ncbi:hypothetical protein L828_3144 [Mycobacteroides abscessus MAB_030201_1061]|nr:hypothetical protein L828_3144 [Mycobacteroides abscessus MAB_030201_1061]
MRFEFLVYSTVALDIANELLCPPFFICFRSRRVLRTAMPEATIDENG